ncbi:MAG: carbohydrate ABC transporter permease [Chloroflexota bacterium]|nr:carbohydrate ABC transporter permease [Chloroflexota bacterium]
MAVNVDTAVRPLAAPRATRERKPGERGGAGLGRLVLYVVLFALAALFMFPFAWLILTSFKAPANVFAPGFFPDPWYPRNYRDVFEIAPVARWLWNSFFVAGVGVLAVLLSSSLVAFGFARLRFRGRKQLFALVMATYLLPSMVTLIPTFLIWNELGAVNTTFPLWAGNLFGSAFYIFMLRQFFYTIPQDLVDAARVDGAGYFRIYWNIMLPLIKPALAVVAVFEFQALWNDLMRPLIYLNQPKLYTMALGLSTMKSDVATETNWAIWMAASVVLTVPMVILFFFAQRYLVEGVATTGLKG